MNPIRLLCAGLFAAALPQAAPADGVHPALPSHRLPPAASYSASGVPPSTSSGTGHDPAALIRAGGVLYEQHCLSCHGADFRGAKGIPSLEHAGGAAVDFYMTTGRMPAPVTDIQNLHQDVHFTVEQIAAIDAFVDAHVTTVWPVPAVHAVPSALPRGRQIYEENCQACHGSAAQGATVGYGWLAPALDRATPVQIGEAIRFGPGMMPRFGTRLLSADDVNAVATYVTALREQPQSYGGWDEDNLGVVAEGFIGGVLGIGAIVWVAYMIGTKTDEA